MSEQSLTRDRMILNANLHRTNTLEFNEFHQTAVETLEQLTELILPLCGPKAMNDLVVYEHVVNDKMSNVFSNDGLHIMKSLEYMSPIQEFLVGYVRYIADRVERAAGDGTSTAIYLACQMMLSAMNARQDLTVPGITPVVNPVTCKLTERVNHHRRKMQVTGQVKQQFEATLNELINNLQHLRIDLKEVSTTIRQELIYRLAYTTSKGNEKLSKYLVDLFTDLPEVLYEQTHYNRSKVETNEPFTVEYPEYDLLLSVHPSATTQYNAKLHTEWHHKGVDFLPVVTVIDSQRVGVLLDFIKEYQEGDNPQLLLLVNGIDETSLSKVERLIDPRKVTLTRMTYYHPLFLNNPTELQVTLAMAGQQTDAQKTVADYWATIITDVDIRMNNRSCWVSRMFDSETDSLVHPLYLNPEAHQPYTNLRLDLEHQIDELKNSHQAKERVSELKEFVRIYRMMVGPHLPILTIGGSVVDHLAMVNIVEDVLGVVSVAMRHGVILDTIPKLQYLSTRGGVDSYQFRLASIFEAFWKLTYQSPDELYSQLVTVHSADEILNPDENPKSPRLANLLWHRQGQGWVELSESTATYATTVQSYKAITETFDRLLETIPRLVSVDRIIVPNSVVQKKE